mmetsp:Transcript_12225/g.18505  ORF Transcript_12225/g.18505 Transcript_12225/m.18505 type:complete len:544 (+) Transcript_12225:93-1724(+)|eukprot:CAMPEP_0185024310 /NCGR_PEP_ID=MMETSP1103-20130426/7325_1 /TAXON_ID=36769 /ORGANISM="Paraphysomonas bandaiensis, Strain Caron Lab Isolate" /LENGTH=543 /DNA_ID=CAMNT_0027557237 /DNA_START=78 /DNA_END=1709 /DNA_ORIENTATION=-
MNPIRFILFLNGLITVLSYKPQLLIETDLGSVEGHVNGEGVREWVGIPYAEPPVGSLRWEYPRSPSPWSDVYVANKNPPGCAQNCTLPPGTGTCPDYVSEDCLFLSVFAPLMPPTDPNGYPVIFFMHGGAFTDGLGACALYNGTNFAKTADTIVVAINYRLGAFGFMASASMQGNYGFMDQRLALEWVQRNIRSFGGDPTRVTASGQSAGAMSVGAHLVSPGSRGLFQRGLMESNPLGLPFHSRESAQENADNVALYLNCPVDDVECMREKTMAEILDAQKHAPELNLDTLFINFLPWSPMVEEGGEIPLQPIYALGRGDFEHMPLLSGSTRDEGQMFVYELFLNPLSEEAYKAVILATFGRENYKQIIDMYPYDIVEGTTDGRDACNVLATDLLFYCPLRNVTRGYQNRLGVDKVPSYIYRFEHVLSEDLSRCWEPNTTYCIGYVCHASELCFVFDVFTDGKGISYDITLAEEKLAMDIPHMWSNFAASGSPNKGLFNPPIVFPPYVGMDDSVLFIEEPGMSVDSHFRDDFCNMWDTLGYIY